MRPLEDLRVVDMADEKGELCGRLLADLGAEVIRVEPPGGASSRRLPPFAPDAVTSLYFAVRNAGKRGLELDVTAAADRERLHDLLRDADVLIESHAPGFLARHALGPAELLARYPRLVVTSITDFGQTGPYRDYLGTDMIGFAMGGLMHRSGAREKPPVVAPGALAYDTAGTTAAFATLVACWKRLRTGRGQHLDISVMESVANLSDWALPNYSRSPTIGHRTGAGIYTLYRCADGWVRTIVLVKHHWRALLDWIGNPEALADPALDELVPRLARMPEIQALVERFFADKRKIDVAREAQSRGIPATPLLRPSEVIGCEHCEERGTFADLEVAPGLLAKVPSGFFTIDGGRVGPGTSRPGFDGWSLAGAAAALCGGAPAADASPAGADPYPFRGLRVLDFGVGAVGVEVGRLLAEFGADVVKVESRKAPDFIRVLSGSFMNPSFASSNRSKRSFGVDLKAPAGRDLMLRLAVDADVVIENSGTGVMERFGLGYAALREKNPGVVMFSSQMMGSVGPWKDWIGYGPSTHPVCGLQYLWNYPEDAERPAGSTNVYPDHFVGRLGAFGVVAGLLCRSRTGRGMHFDAAQFESPIQLLGDLFARESLVPGSVAPLGNGSALGAPWGAYPCAGDDEWCVINVRSDGEWRALCGALGDPDWTRRPEYREAAGRIERRAEIDRALAEWTAERGPREVMETLQGRGVPAGIVAHPGHHFEDPQLAARGYFKPVEQGDLGRIVLEGMPFLGSDLPEPITAPAPLLGEHTREICRERLGLSDAEIEALFEAGVLEDPT